MAISGLPTGHGKNVEFAWRIVGIPYEYGFFQLKEPGPGQLTGGGSPRMKQKGKHK